MAFTTWTNKNKRVEVPLTRTFSREQASTAYNYWGAGKNWWKISQRTRKVYSYVGLTAEAAAKCLQSMTNYWTRPFSYWGKPAKETATMQPWRRRYMGSFPDAETSFSSGDKYWETVANISITKNNVTYTVRIDVDEIISVYAIMDDREDKIPRISYEYYFREIMLHKKWFMYDE